MEYTPKIINDKYVLFAAESRKCPLCGKIMIKKVPSYFKNSFFPVWCEMNQDAQMKRANLVYISTTMVDNEYICEECDKGGKANFKCELCGDRKSTNKIQETFGDPPVFLCEDCYETIPAKKWDVKCEQLLDEHRYDFE